MFVTLTEMFLIGLLFDENIFLTSLKDVEKFNKTLKLH